MSHGRRRPEEHARVVERCVYCGGPLGTVVVARERQFGLPGEFAYGVCRDCESLTLTSPH